MAHQSTMLSASHPTFTPRWPRSLDLSALRGKLKPQHRRDFRGLPGLQEKLCVSVDLQVLAAPEHLDLPRSSKANTEAPATAFHVAVTSRRRTRRRNLAAERSGAQRSTTESFRAEH